MSAESSERLMNLAEHLRKHDDPRVRSLAMSVLRQFEPDADSPITKMKADHRYRHEHDPKFWEGFWAGMWACAR